MRPHIFGVDHCLCPLAGLQSTGRLDAAQEDLNLWNGLCGRETRDEADRSRSHRMICAQRHKTRAAPADSKDVQHACLACRKPKTRQKRNSRGEKEKPKRPKPAKFNHCKRCVIICTHKVSVYDLTKGVAMFDKRINCKLCSATCR